MVSGLLDDDDLLDLRPRGKRTDPAAFVADERRRKVAVPPENQALREWESRPPSTPTAPAAPQACAACGKPAKATCAQCGLGMCANDAWTMLGLCKRCVADTMRAP